MPTQPTILLLLSIFLFGCSSPSLEINPGTFESKQYGSVKTIMTQLRGYGIVQGCLIDLNKDSTFTYTTCGNISKGVWRLSQPFLILKTNAFVKRSDTTNTFFQVDYCDTFTIKSSTEIERILHFKGGFKSYETLVKLNE